MIECLSGMHDALDSRPAPRKLGMVAHSVLPARGRQRQEISSVTLGYIVGSKPAWAIQDPVSKRGRGRRKKREGVMFIEF